MLLLELPTLEKSFYIDEIYHDHVKKLPAEWLEAFCV